MDGWIEREREREEGERERERERLQGEERRLCFVYPMLLYSGGISSSLVG